METVKNYFNNGVRQWDGYRCRECKGVFDPDNLMTVREIYEDRAEDYTIVCPSCFHEDTAEEEKIINMTPHPVNILDEENNEIATISASGKLIRLKSTVVRDGGIGEIPISKTVFGDPEGLPEYEIGIYYIVSQLVKSACSSRDDLLVPAEVVRDTAGNIIGCRSLGR